MEADDQGVLLEVFGRIVKTGPSHLTGLLDIYILTPEILELLSDIYFPTLRNCIIPLSDSTGSFLRLHPNIIRLVVFNESLPSFDMPFFLTTPSVVLPNLVAFMGPHTVAPVLLGSQTVHVSVPYDPQSAHPYLPVISVLGNCVPSLVTLVNIVMQWDSVLPVAIAAHLPALSSVKIRRISSPDAEDNLPEFLWSLDDMIRALPNLILLHIVLDSPDTSGGHASEFEHVRRWGDISLTFRHALLPSGTIWTCPAHNIWCPGHADAADWLVKEVLCSTSLPPKSLKALEALLGKEQLAEYSAFHDLNRDRG
ncbi:hypothetical protein B0H16DRAFT_1569225 [Mycena metata]|uniref:Uncharacterized protein n=1 Tax=Mycena metata TaxID=1033252 RepID=A0AAD7MZ72_9AGAR|nr:hypothetical protein B0H16DRAFT_1569225 [Mycena metata]